MANKIANRKVICDTLLEAAKTDKDIVVLCSDSRGSASLTPFFDQYPQQSVEVGIAEQDLVSIAAGMASCGKKAWAASPASFVTTRSYEQCKVDVSYSNTNVKLIGISGVGPKAALAILSVCTPQGLAMAVITGDEKALIAAPGIGKKIAQRIILELKDKCYRELSGGQQQRVLLARALCAARSLLILDEPITGLDPAAAQDLYKTLSYLNRKEGMAVGKVTHDLRAALRSARTVLHIGRSSYFLGTVKDYLASPQGRRFREVEE